MVSTNKKFLIPLFLIPLLAIIGYRINKLFCPPNLVLIIIDTLRADKLGCYGFPEEISPELDRLAEKGVLFKNVFAQSSWTRPSIGSMLTSLYPRSLGLYREKFDILPGRHLTLPEILKANGYTTFGITANPNINAVFNFHQGFDQYTDSHTIWRWMKLEKGKVFLSIKGETDKSAFQDKALVLKLLESQIIRSPFKLSPERVVFNPKIKSQQRLAGRLKQLGIEKIDSVLSVWRNSQKTDMPPHSMSVFRKALMFAKSTRGRGPYYIQINIMEVHSPKLMIRPEFNKNFLKLKAHQFPTYHDAIRQVSKHIHMFIRQLVRLPEWENALFVITSDHGEGLGDHPGVADSKKHGHLLYKSQLKVPLILYRHYPKSFLGRWLRNMFPRKFHQLKKGEIEQPVRLLDLMPTLLDFLEIPISRKVEGKSLLKLVNQETARVKMPPYFIAETYFQEADKISVYSDRWEYIENRDRQKGVNPLELQPLGVIENGRVTDKIDEEKEISSIMKKYLQEWERNYPKVKPLSQDLPPSPAEINQLKALGYLN